MNEPSEAEISFRPAAPADLEAIRPIVQRSYGGYVDRMGTEPGPMRADYAGMIADGAVTVALFGGRIVGLLVVLPAADHVLLDNVAVDPQWQGRGIGRALIARAEDHARAAGKGEVRLYTHVTMVENQRLYAALGYEETGRGMQDGFERVFMRKRLMPR